MSYVRFENTLEDLEDCYENINDFEMSNYELKCGNKMITVCRNIIKNAVVIRVKDLREEE